jgi:hypothetical protein
MPYKAFKVDDEFCVYKLDVDGERTGKQLGCHPTEPAADKQVKALYAAEEVEEPETDETTEAAEADTKLREQATSFSALRASRNTEKVVSELIELVYDFRILAENIVYSLDVEDKSAMLRGLAGEFSDEVDVLLGDLAASSESESIAEAEPVTLAESNVGTVLAIHESEDVEGNIAPLQLDIVPIKPGWGNEKDNHYYPRELLEKYAHVLNGAKMYATNHDPKSKNVLTEVSQVLACPAAFTSDGAPIARVGVFDAGFAESIRNRAALGKLEDLHVSIQASGTAKPFELDGRKGKIVETINPDGANVDWVTRAGAGGHALRLAESAEESDMEEEERVDEQVEEAEVEEVAIEEQAPEADAEVEEQEPTEDETVEEETPAPLDAAEAGALLAESNLPDASRARLAKTDWPDEDALTDAIASEVTYVAELTGAGRPVAQGAPVTEPAAEVNKEDELNELYAQVEKDHGVFRGKEEA